MSLVPFSSPRLLVAVLALAALVAPSVTLAQSAALRAKENAKATPTPTPRPQLVRPAMPAPTPVAQRATPAPTATPTPSPEQRADQIAASAVPLDEAARQLRAAGIAQNLAWSALTRHRPGRGSSPAQIAAALIAAGFDRATALDAAADHPQPATSANQAAQRMRGAASAEVVAAHLIVRFRLTLDGVLDAIVHGSLVNTPAQALALAVRAARPTPQAVMQTGFRLHRDGHFGGYPGAADLHRLLLRDQPEALAPAATHPGVWGGLARAGYAPATLFAELPFSDVDRAGRPRDPISACFLRVRPGPSGSGNLVLEIRFSTADAVSSDPELRACYVDFLGGLRRNGFDPGAAEALLDPAIRCTPASHRNCPAERDALRAGLLADAGYPR